MRAFLVVAIAAAVTSFGWLLVRLRADEAYLALARGADVVPPALSSNDPRFKTVNDPVDDAVIGYALNAPVTPEMAREACSALWAEEHRNVGVFRFAGASNLREREGGWEQSLDLLIVIGCDYVQLNRATCDVDAKTGVVRMRESKIRTLASACEEEPLLTRIKRKLFP